MTPAEIIRKAIPDAPNEVCESILWGRTPFPLSPITPRLLYRAADRWRRAEAAGRQLCDHCDNIVIPGRYLCKRCARVLDLGSARSRLGRR